MQSFIVKRQPKSYNKARLTKESGKKYSAEIRESHSNFNPEHTQLKGELYGIVYYFFKKDTGTDADNISKPIWDCLTNYLFEDDKQIKIRVAGCFDLTKKDMSILDITRLPADIIIALLEAIDTEEYIIYIECGTLSNEHFKFNIE
jgi:Holliday junction resolvase RusA-like endonuclease